MSNGGTTSHRQQQRNGQHPEHANPAANCPPSRPGRSRRPGRGTTRGRRRRCPRRSRVARYSDRHWPARWRPLPRGDTCSDRRRRHSGFSRRLVGDRVRVGQADAGGARPGAALVAGRRLRRDQREMVLVRLAGDEGRVVAGADVRCCSGRHRVAGVQLRDLGEAGLDQVDRQRPSSRSGRSRPDPGRSSSTGSRRSSAAWPSSFVVSWSDVPVGMIAYE